MNEKLKFILEMVDKVTRPARRATKALKGVTRAFKRVGIGAVRSSKMLQRFQRIARRVGPLKAFTLLAGRARRNLADLASTPIAKKLGNLATRFGQLAVSAAKFGAILGIIGTVVLARAVFKMTAFAESARLALANLTGGAKQGEKEFKIAIGLAEEYGLEIDKTTQSFIKLRAAQFTLGETTELIKLTTDLRAIGASAEEVKSAIRAITQIKAKGRLQAEELVGQLAEAGIATTLVYDALAKKLGKTTDQVRKLITAGKVSADVGIAAITEAVFKKANIRQAGEAGKQFADSTLAGLFGRLKAAPGFFIFKVSEFLRTDADFKGIIGDILAGFDQFSAVGVADFIKEIMRLFRDAIPLFKEFFAGFGEGFTEVMAALRGTEVAGEDNMEFWRDFGKTLAQALGLGIQLAGLFAKLVKFLVTPIGQASAGFAILAGWIANIVLLAKSLGITWIGIKAVFVATGAKIGTVFGGVKVAAFAVGVEFQVLWGIIQGGLATVGTFLASAFAIPVALAAIGVAAAALSFTFREELAKMFLKAFDATKEFISTWPRFLIEGLKTGLLALIPGLGAVVGGVGSQVVDSIKSKLGISSPSTVMEKLGRQATQGFAEGIGGVGRVGTSVRSLADTATSMRARGGSSRVVMRPVFQIKIEGGVSGGSATQVGQQIGRSAADTFNRHLDQAVASQGG